MSSSRQGFLPKLTIPAGLFRRGINLWPPFVGAGIRVTRISADSREVDVTLKLRLFNRNFFGTHFGGSMFAMTDPFFALMMLRNLGPDYIVWDKAGSIAYLRPGRGDVFAHFRLPAAAVARARKATAHGARHEPTFRVRIVDRDGETVAEAEKTLYIRRRPAAASQAAHATRKASAGRQRPRD
jgi:acyl-coenzyme A thioesterase PaaI-like protein